MASQLFRIAAVAISALLLGGCGGGDGGGGVTTPGTPTPAPVPTPTPSPAPTPSPTPTPGRWTPALTDTWQWQLNGTINSGYDVRVYDVDLVDVPQATIDRLHAQGRRVVCYFSAGSSENFRQDFSSFLSTDLGRALDGWEGERWLDVRSANVRAVMRRRLDAALAKRCDGVEPDNVDGYANGNGLGLTAADQLDYNRFLSTEAHLRNLAVALKNDLDQVPALVAAFDFAVNEQCHEYQECGALQPFIAAGKPVFNAEYAARYRNDSGTRATLCATARGEGVRTLVLPLELDDAFRQSCD